MTACFLINRMPSKVLQFQTPLQALQKYVPKNRIFSELDLRIFGCTTFVHLHDPSLSKLDARSCKCIFLEYSSVQKGYRCYLFEKIKYFVSKNVTFIENTFFFKQNPNQGEMSLDPIKDSNFQDQNTISDLNLASNLDWEVFWHSELPKENPTNTFETTDLIPQNQASIPSEPTNSDPILPNPNEPPNLPKLSHPEQTPPSKLTTPFLKTYSRKKVTHKASDMETSTHHESNPTTGNELTLNELDIPIALKTGQRSCTQHPISKFLGYSHLSTPI